MCVCLPLSPIELGVELRRAGIFDKFFYCKYWAWVNYIADTSRLFIASFFIIGWPPFEGAALMAATQETLQSSIDDFDSSDAKSIIDARDAVPAPPQDTGLDSVDKAVAEEEVTTFGPMVDWGVKEVLRFINSVDDDLFDEVKGIFAAQNFDG